MKSKCKHPNLYIYIKVKVNFKITYKSESKFWYTSDN